METEQVNQTNETEVSNTTAPKREKISVFSKLRTFLCYMFGYNKYLEYMMKNRLRRIDDQEIRDKYYSKFVRKFRKNNLKLSKDFSADNVNNIFVADLWIESHASNLDLLIIKHNYCLSLSYFNLYRDFDFIFRSSFHYLFFEVLEILKNEDFKCLENEKNLISTILARNNEASDFGLEFLTKNKIPFPKSIQYKDCNHKNVAIAYLEANKDSDLRAILKDVKKNCSNRYCTWSAAIVSFLKNNIAAGFSWPKELNDRSNFSIEFFETFFLYNKDNIYFYDIRKELKKTSYYSYNDFVNAVLNLYPEKINYFKYKDLDRTCDKILWLKRHPKEAEIAFFGKDEAAIDVALEILKEGKFSVDEYFDTDSSGYSYESKNKLKNIFVPNRYFR